MPILNKFDGGIAEDLRTHATDQCADSFNFDIFTNPHKLIPIPDSIAETSGTETMDKVEISDVVYGSYNGGTSYYYAALGRELEASAKPAIYIKVDGNLTDTFTQQAVGTGAVQKGALAVYKDYIYTISTTGHLFKYVGAGALTDVGTVTMSGTTPYLLVHPKDNILYAVAGTSIGKYDGTTFSEVTTILPGGMKCAGICEYGDYLAIAMNPKSGVGNTIVYLWNRDTSLNTLSESVNLGTGQTKILDNLDGRLFAVSINERSTTAFNTINIRGWAGGQVEEVKSLQVPTAISILHYKAIKNNKLLFGSGGDTAIYSFGKNKSGIYTLTHDRYFTDGTAIGSSFGSISTIGEILWIGSYDGSGVFSLYRTKTSTDSLTYTNTSIYKTTINPSMPLGDRHKYKKLNKVSILYTGASIGTTTLKYSTDGDAMTTIISNTNASGEQYIEAFNENDGTPFLDGREYQFQIESTGGSQIKEISYEYKTI